MYDAYVRSEKIAEHVGMIAFNINVVNAIAAIFTATGQDIACVGESSTGFWTLTRLKDSIRFEVLLTNLIVGTVGGGTALPAQNSALRLMDCAGTDKVARFASVIAGFTLALELSTFAALAGGQFARAHQVFGRNKSKNWLVRSEFDQRFVKPILQPWIEEDIVEIDFSSQARLDNGILTDLSSKLIKKMVGFIPMTARTEKGKSLSILAKSKALDSEIMKGVHYMASHVDTGLADAILAHSTYLEYAGSHIKEIEVFEYLSNAGFTHMPKYYGSKISPDREIYVLFQELLRPPNLSHYNTELSPDSWSMNDTKAVINALVDFQLLTISEASRQNLPNVQSIDSNALSDLYIRLLE